MKTFPRRHRAPLRAGAATAATLWAGLALACLAPFAAATAQETNGVIPPPGAPTPPEMLAPLPPDGPDHEGPGGQVAGDLAPERGEAPTKKQRLDGLFAELAALGPDDKGARRRVAGEIARLWSLSGSDTIDLLLRRGRQAMDDGEHRRALAHFSALTDHAPGFAEGWNARATAYFILKEWGMALADIERTLELEPRHFGALTGLGVILEKIDRPEDALRAWRRALEVHPHLERAVEAVERLSVKVEGRDI